MKLKSCFACTAAYEVPPRLQMSETEELLNFVAGLPPTLNPYYATANKLEALIRAIPQKPTMGTPTQGCRFGVICHHLLPSRVPRIPTGETVPNTTMHLIPAYLRGFGRIISYFAVGLLVINISDSSALAYFFYAPRKPRMIRKEITIYVISVNVALDRGYKVDMAPMLCVYGHKFFPILLGSW
ncbi:hypothetical protein VP01_2822g3 [Puccinia sorghi]|uniref:Uncharacterized protein n=1 Tax=Puccinia sorghi TaxID=27349 RepID=A0A0L6V441_9BASI|nr:hypothetical protein VP01_2822g3 [Puccinia sorghi]